MGRYTLYCVFCYRAGIASMALLHLHVKYYTAALKLP